MKKYILILATFAFASANAQVGVTKTDSIETGASYLNDVYYQLSSGTKTSLPNNTWHLAFRTGGQTDGIRINSATVTGAGDGSVKLYLYPNSNVAGWASFDTAGYTGWLRYENSDESWEVGAFNRAAGQFPDFSWGIYNLDSHVVFGDSLYLVEYKHQGTSKFKKLWIVKKASSNFTFKFADVDGTNEEEVVLRSADFSGRNYMYYNLETKTSENREPASAEWDFLLTRYQALQFNGSYAAATGILTNIGVQVAVGDGKAVADLNLEDFLGDTSDLINTIGYDWKHYEMGQQGVTWYTEDSLAFFIKDRKGIFWKVAFTAFGGSANGKTVFNKTQLTPGTSVRGNDARIVGSAVYPNPTSGNLQVLVSVEEATNAVVEIYNLNGQLLMSQNAEVNGLEAISLNVAGLTTGTYLVKVSGQDFVSVQRFVRN